MNTFEWTGTIAEEGGGGAPEGKPKACQGALGGGIKVGEYVRACVGDTIGGGAEACEPEVCVCMLEDPLVCVCVPCAT